MAQSRLTFTDLFAGLAVGIVCFLLLMPNIEASRTEARLGQAYIDVLKLAKSPDVQRRANDEAQNADTPGTVALAEVDPWDTPYRAMLVDDKLRVLSAGPNETFDMSEMDSDDIHSDLPVSPVERIRARKRMQFLVAAGAFFATWIVVASLYVWSRRRRSS